MSTENIDATDKDDTIAGAGVAQQASVDSLEEEPEPSQHVQFAADAVVMVNYNTSNSAPTQTHSSSNKAPPITIPAISSNSAPLSVNTQLDSPHDAGADHLIQDILNHTGMITAHSQTIRSLQYLQSLRVEHRAKSNPIPAPKGSAYYESPRAYTSRSPMTRSVMTNGNNEVSVVPTIDNLEDAESQINDSISSWTLKFISPIREKQFRIFVTERYGTSIRVAILSMIVAYIFLAGTNASFVKDATQVIFVCIGLLIMLTTFSVASSFSTASSSITTSYLKSIFQSSAATTDQVEKRGELTPENHDADDKQIDLNIATALKENTEQKKPLKTQSKLVTLQRTLHRWFGLYSSHMVSLCVIALLLLLVLQNTFGSLTDDRFLVYYLLASLVTSTYGSCTYFAYLICSWSLYVVWNILAIAVHKTSKEQSFDFWGVNIALIIGNLVLGHQVKAKDMARRKTFMRAMNYVNYWNQSHAESAAQKSVATPNFTPHFHTPKLSIYRSNAAGIDITTMPSIREKLSAAILESVVDKSLMASNAETDDERSQNTEMEKQITSAGSLYSGQGSPKKRLRKHERQKSRLYADMRRELTKRGTAHSSTGPSGAARDLGVKLGLNQKRDSSGLGIFNMVRGFGGNLAHLDTHDEEDEGTVSELLEPSNETYFSSKTNGRYNNSSSILHEEEEKYHATSAGNATALKTVQSQRALDQEEEENANANGTNKSSLAQNEIHSFLQQSLTNSDPHCGSIHELPVWYSLTAEPYILCGYRINYDVKLCFKSMFQAHNETVNIWTEFIPAIVLFALLIHFNLDDGHFWVNSTVHGSFTQSILTVSMPFIVVRPIVSGLAHTFTCISKKSTRLWWKFDFFSIVVAAGFGSVIWTHCIFFCEPNIQVLYMFACLALSFSTTITALTSKNQIIRDLSLGAFFVFTLIFLYFYELYILFLSNKPKNAPYSTMIYWTISVLCTFSGVIFRASKYPEAFFVKRRFKKLMQATYDQKFSISSGGQQIEYQPTTQTETVRDHEHDNKEMETAKSQRDAQASFKQQVSFQRMLKDVQSFTLQTERKLARIEALEKNLYDDMDDAELERRKEKLISEIEVLEDEIVNEIKNEIQIEACMEEAYVSLISGDQRQWFNYILTSHNFWHIFMNLAVMFSVVAWKQYFEWRAMDRNQC